ncbi:CTP--2,3-di-O-geranylgeranyl-sn-glycero-1-phosphate cytidyltransferase [Candidatus Pacearchaeota archaeon]|nr:CTP--2,3-di-O-geranylgeranyl-sn-glycero-1-phosphate cytidyltransferase [Candidatus Pacearchaeota archaeon]
MKWNFKQELARKFIHFLSVFILFIYFLASDIFNKHIALLFLVLILIIAIEFEYFRIEIGSKIPLVSHVWKYLRRKKEKATFGGDVFFLIGAILVLAIFDIRVAMAAILMTTFGDLAAALVGTKYGKHQVFGLKNRSWEGTLTELAVDLLIGIGVFFRGAIYDISLIYSWQLWLLVGIMAITATFVETIIYKLDDNLMIQIFAGFNGQIALVILKYNNLFPN